MINKIERIFLNLKIFSLLDCIFFIRALFMLYSLFICYLIQLALSQKSFIWNLLLFQINKQIIKWMNEQKFRAKYTDISNLFKLCIYQIHFEYKFIMMIIKIWDYFDQNFLFFVYYFWILFIHFCYFPHRLLLHVISNIILSSLFVQNKASLFLW